MKAEWDRGERQNQWNNKELWNVTGEGKVVLKVHIWRGQRKVRKPGQEVIHHSGLYAWWLGEGLWLLFWDEGEVTVIT